MRVNRRILGLAFAIFFTLLAAAKPAVAQGYPTQTVRIIAPYAAGGGTDILARIIAEAMSDAFGKPFVVENRTGANGVVGAEIVAKAPADGHTLLMGSNGPNVVNAVIYEKLPYDPLNGFAAISLIALVPNVLLISPAIPAKNVQELIALARSRPGVLSFGSAGIGSPAHLAGELFKALANVDMVHVPYKGGAATLADLLSGRIDVMFGDQLFATPLVRSGKLRALAVSTAKRSNTLPELPTVAEAGIPGYETGLWYGLFAPAGTPKEIVAKLNGEIIRRLEQPEMRERIGKLGGEVVASSPSELESLVKSEFSKWSKVTKQYGIRAQP